MDDVLSAMERRALAAERAADDTASRLAQLLEESSQSERALADALQSLEDSAQPTDVLPADAARTRRDVAEGQEAQADLNQRLTGQPALSKMRKADLVAELQRAGAATEGLKVPELRSKLRAMRKQTPSQ